MEFNKIIIKVSLIFILIFNFSLMGIGYAFIVDHTSTNIKQIPQSAIEQAKQSLHIAYGHTSHGSQLTTGMTSLVGFMNGLGYPENLYSWNESGNNNSLDLDDYAMGGDVGYYPQWVNNTRAYLDTHPDVNVIIWSWCGQVSDRTEQGMIDTYLNPMNQLETDYPNVTFVYMTGHSDGTGLSGNVHLRNQQIRNYCTSNNKVLYDFYDIELYNPDGNYFGDKLVNDACDYDSDGNGTQDANWAIEWQDSHTENIDWYNCSSAHSQPLNANQKAYAAWWLWARLAGWNPISDSTPPSVPQNLKVTVISETQIDLSWDASTDNESGVSYYRIYKNGLLCDNASILSYSSINLIPNTTYRFQISAVNGAGTESNLCSEVTATTLGDTQDPTSPTNLSAQAVSSSQINLSWTASTDNVGIAGYRIFRNGSEIATITGTNYQDQGLNAATSYTYRVSAFDAAGNESALSSPATATTIVQQTTTIRLEDDDAGEVVDAFLFQANPDTNYGSTTYVSTIDRFIIKFNLPSEVMNKYIVDAKLGLFVWNQTNYVANQYIDIYRVTKNWQEDSVTWNNAQTQVNWTTPGGDYGEQVARIEHQSGAANWDHTYYPLADITPLVQKWVKGTSANYGVLVINNSQTGIGIKASEYSSHPFLEITYSDSFPIQGKGMPAILGLLLSN
ncbi:MAG: DNRLRE domain-containing protein [Desulfobacterales bacterium]|nr:DNRLRE domain-containing protein [Desulfobacterales bacterium]